MTRKSTHHHSVHFFYTSKKSVIKKIPQSELKRAKYLQAKQKPSQKKKTTKLSQLTQENIFDIYSTNKTSYKRDIAPYIAVDNNNSSALLFCVILVSLFARAQASMNNFIIKGPCSAELKFPTFNLPITCDYNLHIADHEFFELVMKLNHVVQEATATRVVKCKLEQVSKDKMQRILLVDDESLQFGQPARYELSQILISKNNFFNNESQDYFRHELHHAYLDDRFDKNINAKKFVKYSLPTPVDTSNQADLDRYVRLLGRGINRINKLLRQVEDNIITVDSSWHEDTINYQPRVMKTLFSQKRVDELIKDKHLNKDLSLRSNHPVEVGKPLFQFPNGTRGFLDKHKTTMPVYLFSIEKFNNQYLASLYSVKNLHNKLEAALKDILLIIDHGYKLNPNSVISQTAEIEAYLHQLLEKMPELFSALFGELLDWQFEQATSEFKACMFSG